MTIPELLRHILKGSGKSIYELREEWPFQCSMKTLYNRLNDTSVTAMRVCDLEILSYAWHNGFAAEALAVLTGQNVQLTTMQRASFLFPDLSFGEITAITSILRVSPQLALTDDAIRGIVKRRRAEVASSTFPGAS